MGRMGAFIEPVVEPLGEAERADTWAEIEQTLLRFETPAAGFVGPCEMLVGAGTR